MSEEVQGLQAILGRVKPAREVVQRDFRKPRRLGHARLRALTLALENLMPQLERSLAARTGLQLGVTLDGLDENDAEHLFRGAVEPLCVLRFACAGAPAWLAWDPAAAVDVLETLFGSPGGALESRKLSPTEQRVCGGLLQELARQVTGCLGLGVDAPVLVQAASELGTWREGGPDAESHRLEVRLRLVNGARESRVRLYLPGIADEDPAARLALPETLPGHLERVEIEVCARLDGCEISLDQLLALEEGDVIPLEARVGDPTTLSVEGLTLARGRLGSHRGRLAVRIEELDVQTPSVA